MPHPNRLVVPPDPSKAARRNLEGVFTHIHVTGVRIPNFFDVVRSRFTESLSGSVPAARKTSTFIGVMSWPLPPTPPPASSPSPAIPLTIPSQPAATTQGPFRSMAAPYPSRAALHRRQHHPDPGIRPGRHRHHYDRRVQRRLAGGASVRGRRQRHADRRLGRRIMLFGQGDNDTLSGERRQRPAVRRRRQRHADRRRWR